MSWYVEYLFLNSDEIRSSIIGEGDGESVNVNLEDDAYSDLLTAERELLRMYRLGLVSERDFNIVKKIQEGCIYTDLVNVFNLNQFRISWLFRATCDKIAFYLGDYFTDDGFYSYICERYELNEVEESKLRDKIFGRNHE